MSDTDRRRTRDKPWPECLTDNQLMALLRKRMPEKYGDLSAAPRRPEGAIAAILQWQEARAAARAPSGAESAKGEEPAA